MILISLIWVILMSSTLVPADDYRIGGWDSVVKEHEWEPHEPSERGEEGISETNKGGEIVGQITAGLFGVANLPVILSLLIKGTIRIFSVNPQSQS